MKLERHIAVIIGESLEASSTALQGRCNARLAWFFARVAMTLVNLVAPPVRVRRSLGLDLCPSVVRQRLERSAPCQSRALLPVPCPGLCRRTLGTDTLSDSLGTLGSALLSRTFKCYAGGP